MPGYAKKYTVDELEMIRQGIVPEGLKRRAVIIKANELGIDFPKHGRPWTPEETALLRDNKPVPTRDVHSCYNKAGKLGIQYSPKGPSFREQHRKSVENHDAIIEEVKATGNIRATGRKYGVSYTTVSMIAKKAGITNNPSPKERMGVSIVYDGITWVWTDHCRGYWRESSGKRRNLARYIYAKTYGPITSSDVIILKNGDRMDLRPENLEKVSKSEQMIRLQKNPETRAVMLAGAAMGRLTVKIKEKTDPEYRAERYRQRADVCRQMRMNKIAKNAKKP